MILLNDQNQNVNIAMCGGSEIDLMTRKFTYLMPWSRKCHYFEDNYNNQYREIVFQVTCIKLTKKFP